ncbi:unnamed protein product [Rhizophagus irregularis]|uniref:RecQ mediated genome instability protein 1 OB-fold domain-containing protein n=2 Tax=Rhizophagus irregularis TaxID=588596 RepID=A0A915YUV2_9GLOM|nr:unnamed protein product [Rhizophagus irregularis]CAB5341315.1 unnamed protein product [Rhizophagus irregularis]
MDKAPDYESGDSSQKMISSGIDESIFHHIETMFSKTTFEFRRDGLEKALVKVLSEKEEIHINELLNRIFFELLHSDLSDVIYPILPNLNDFQDGYIAQNGPILLEIVECIEVGISTYKLLQILNEFESSQVNNAKDDELEKKLEFPRKMLHLLLSDGQQQIRGMEYKQVSELSLHTPIGKKVLISNVKYSKGMLFLTPENTYVCEGFEWTSRRLGDLKLTFMELLGMATNENVEDESQISYNALHPCDIQSTFQPNMGGRLARVIFKDVPYMSDLTKLKRFLHKAESSHPPPRSVLPFNEVLGYNSNARKSSCPEPGIDKSTQLNSMSRDFQPESSFNNTIRPISVTQLVPLFNGSTRPNANEDPSNSVSSSISSFNKPTFKVPLNQFNVGTPSLIRPNPPSKSLYDEPAFKTASLWNGPAEKQSLSQPNASFLYNDQEATEPAFKKSSTLLSTARPTFRSSSPAEEKTSFIEPSFNASSIRSDSEEKAPFNNRLSSNSISCSHISISSNELDLNISPIRPNSKFKDTESKVSYSMHSIPGVDPFSIQDDDFSYMLIEDDNIETYKENKDNESYSKKGSTRDQDDDGVIIIDSDRDVKDLCHIKNNIEAKNNLASLFESLENEYKAISSEPDARLSPARSMGSTKNNSSNNNKNKRSWLYEKIDSDDDDIELPLAKRVSHCTDNDHEEKLDGGSLANPIVLDYDDNDYEMDLDEILSGYTF